MTQLSGLSEATGKGFEPGTTPRRVAGDRVTLARGLAESNEDRHDSSELLRSRTTANHLNAVARHRPIIPAHESSVLRPAARRAGAR